MPAARPREAFVWIWLPDRVEPVVAGVIRADAELFTFRYGASYLQRPDAVPIFLPELPLVGRVQRPGPGLSIHGCLRDAGPDAWGQRVILARRHGRLDATSDTADLDQLTYLLESGSDRIGALDFQVDPVKYVPRPSEATLEELMTAAQRLAAGEELAPAAAEALLRGTSIGGARPKALVDDAATGRKLIAKFSTATDPYPVVKAEAVAMDLARRAGLDVAASTLVEVLGKSVLLVERFDRVPSPEGFRRRSMVSALTLFGLDEMQGRYGTYPMLAELIRRRFTAPEQTLRELFGRIVVNICLGNTDDHARNHAAFLLSAASGEDLTLTPAFDICPQPRSGETAAQAMAIHPDGRRESRLALCVEAADTYLLTAAQAKAIIDEQVEAIRDAWPESAERARLTAVERRQLWQRQILNPAIFYPL